MESQRPLPLILARNLITSIGTPALLVDQRGNLLFYNEAAGALLGTPFEELGKMDADAWIATFGPLDERGEPIPLEEMPLTIALRNGRPAHSRHRVRSTRGGEHEIEASAFPIVDTESASSGAMIIFWPLDSEGAGTRGAEARVGAGEDDR
jgi:PAS domain-containing protein